MAGGRRYRHAQGLRQPGGAGADGARAGSVLWSRVLLPRPPWRSSQAVVVGWRWPVPVRQAAGARAIRLAACRGGRSGPEPGAIVDAARGDRLADAAANMAAGAGRLSVARRQTAANWINQWFDRLQGCGSGPPR